MANCAVLGLGAGGKAVASMLTAAGHSVRVWDICSDLVAPLKKTRTIKVDGIKDFQATLDAVCDDLPEAVKGVDSIFIVVPAYAHAPLARAIAPHVNSSQLVVLNPGRTAGALEFKMELMRSGCSEVPHICETQTLLYTCRSKGPEHVEIMAIKKTNKIASLSLAISDEHRKLIEDMYQGVVWSDTSLVTGMNNIGAILHPAPVLMNTGWIESRTAFFPHYYSGISRTIAKFLEAMDEERTNVATALDVDVSSVKHWHGEVYGVEGDDLYTTLQMNSEYASLDAPYDLTHRYITDDLPTGLVPMSELGRAVGVETPRIDLIIDLANCVLECDFREDGRNLKKLNLQGKDTNAIKRAFAGDVEG